MLVDRTIVRITPEGYRHAGDVLQMDMFNNQRKIQLWIQDYLNGSMIHYRTVLTPFPEGIRYAVMELYCEANKHWESAGDAWINEAKGLVIDKLGLAHNY